jgi:hypothetical protein
VTYVLMCAGVRLKQIAFLKVQVYGIGIYAEISDIAASFSSFKGTPPDILVKDDALFKKLAEGLYVVSEYISFCLCFFNPGAFK